MPLPNAPDYSQRIYELLKETDLENLSYAQFQSVAEKIFIEPENEDEMRRLVLVQLARMAVRGDWDGFLTGGGGGGGAPTDAEYVVMSLNGTLTNERVLTAGTGISVTDGGAGSNATIANTGVTSNVAGTGISVSAATGASTITNTGVTSLVAGTNITLSPVSGVGDVTVTAATPTGLAPNDASYLTLGLDGDLTNERVLTAGPGISFTDLQQTVVIPLLIENYGWYLVCLPGEIPHLPHIVQLLQAVHLTLGRLFRPLQEQLQKYKLM
jgi:hypothetical protein